MASSLQQRATLQKADHSGTSVARVGGLDPTGVADAYATIQAALTAAGNASASQKEVRLPTGTFKVSNTLIVPSGVDFRGEGEGQTILRGPSGALAGATVSGTTAFALVVAVAATNVSVSDLTVDLATNQTQANGIALLPASVTAGDFQGTPCSKATVAQCEVLGYNVHQYLIWSVMSVDTTIAYNRVDGTNAATGTDCCGIEVAGGRNVLVLANTILRTGQCGINLPDIIANNTRTAIKVLFNTIGTPWAAGGTPAVDGADYGISINNGGSIDTGATIVGLTVHGNHIWGPRIRGISFTCGVNVTVDDVSIDMNDIHLSGGSTTGVALVGDATLTSTKVAVIRNTIEGATASTSTSAAITVNNFPNSRINENSIRTSAAHGAYIGNSADCEFSDNRISNVQLSALKANITARLVARGNVVHSFNIANSSNPAFQVDSSFDPKVTANSVDVGSGTSYYAVYITSGCVRGVERDNDVLGLPATAAPTRNDGTNPNKGTFTAPNDGSTKTLTVSNSLLRSFMTVFIQQEGGTAQPFVLTTASAAFTITWPAATTGQTYRYEVVA